MKDWPTMAFNLSAEEQKHVEDAQEGLARAKKRMKQAVKAAGELMEIQKAAGRMGAYAEAYAFRCALERALAEIGCAHSVGTSAMVSCFGDSGGPVVFGGDGGR